MRLGICISCRLCSCACFISLIVVCDFRCLRPFFAIILLRICVCLCVNLWSGCYWSLFCFHIVYSSPVFSSANPDLLVFSPWLYSHVGGPSIVVYYLINCNRLRQLTSCKIVGHYRIFVFFLVQLLLFFLWFVYCIFLVQSVLRGVVFTSFVFILFLCSVAVISFCSKFARRSS